MSSTIDLFNLPTYRLTRAEQDDHDVHLYAEVCTPASACIHCHEVSLEGFGRRERHIKDLPMQGMDDNSAVYGIPEMKPETLPKPPKMDAPKNYGVDIEKMLKMLENGEL